MFNVYTQMSYFCNLLSSSSSPLKLSSFFLNFLVIMKKELNNWIDRRQSLCMLYSRESYVVSSYASTYFWVNSPETKEKHDN